jgi:uncharacterized protein YycO
MKKISAVLVVICASLLAVSANAVELCDNPDTSVISKKVSSLSKQQRYKNAIKQFRDSCVKSDGEISVDESDAALSKDRVTMLCVTPSRPGNQYGGMGIITLGFTPDGHLDFYKEGVSKCVSTIPYEEEESFIK